VIRDPTHSSNWYSYNPDGFCKTSVKKLNEHTFHSFDNSNIKLGNLVSKYEDYDFMVGTMKDIPSLPIIQINQLVSNVSEIDLHERKSDLSKTETNIETINAPVFDIFSYNTDTKLTHIFLHYKFNSEKISCCNTGTYLVDQYKGWKNHYKDMVKHSYKHVFNLKDNKLEIKIGDKIWILEKYQITDDNYNRLYGKWDILEQSFMSFHGIHEKGGKMFEYSFSQPSRINGENDSIVELYFQPKDSMIHGKSYKYYASEWEQKEYQNIIAKFVSQLESE
jgi:hypothetical protein